MSEDPTKLQVLRGLGNIAVAGVTEVNRYAPTVIDALMCAIDDPNETIAREAINGLSKVRTLDAHISKRRRFCWCAALIDIRACGRSQSRSHPCQYLPQNTTCFRKVERQDSCLCIHIVRNDVALWSWRVWKHLHGATSHQPSIFIPSLVRRKHRSKSNRTSKPSSGILIRFSLMRRCKTLAKELSVNWRLCSSPKISQNSSRDLALTKESPFRWASVKWIIRPFLINQLSRERSSCLISLKLWSTASQIESTTMWWRPLSNSKAFVSRSIIGISEVLTESNLFSHGTLFALQLFSSLASAW